MIRSGDADLVVFAGLNLEVAQGEAPPQYPDADDFEDDAPRWGINLTTGERIVFGGRK